MEYTTLEQTLKIEFDPGELRRVFIHRSYLNEHAEESSNERLEFLGDAVLELITTEYLYELYPDKQEGELTAIRSALVKRSQLATVARDLKLGQYLLFSRGEEKAGGSEKDYILANTFEALLGCINLLKGYDEANRVVKTFLLEPYLEPIIKSNSHIDAKSKLQEMLQEKSGVTPHYELQSHTGPDHNKVFVMGVYKGADLLGTGQGSSKQKAEEQAALDALKTLGWI